MCDFRIDAAEIRSRFGIPAQQLGEMFRDADRAFEGMLHVSEQGLSIPPAVRPLTRLIARQFDAYDMSQQRHSSAI